MQDQPQTTTEDAVQPQAPKRNAATKLWVYYEHDGQKGLVAFNFKSELDAWMATTQAKVVTIVRGVEKKFIPTNHVRLA